MGRRPRHEVLYDGCYAHVFSRSFNHHGIFKETDHFETFRTLLQMVKRMFGFGIHHYCLMSTHFHLVSSIPSVKKFSEGLRHLKSEYTRYFNQKLNRTGPLWRERFKSLLIEDERYLSACGLYVEANPLAAGMVAKPEDWPYSSARHYLVGITDSLVDEYEASDVPEMIDIHNKDYFTRGWAIGSELFRRQVRARVFGETPVPKKVPGT